MDVTVPLETYSVLALRSSILFSKDWTIVSRILGRGGLWALFLSLLRIPARFPWCFMIRRFRGLFKWPLFSSAFRRISRGHVGFVDKVVLKQVSVVVPNVQKHSFVVGDQCRRYVCKKRKQKVNKSTIWAEVPEWRPKATAPFPLPLRRSLA